MMRTTATIAGLASWLACTASVGRAGDIPIVEGIPPGFEMVRLTDDPTMEHSVPDINDCGEVVFGKFVSADAIGNLYRFSGGVIQQLTDDSTYDLNIVTNNLSQIAWNTCVNSNGPFDVVSSYVEGSISGAADPANFIDMNDAGDVVWKHAIVPGGTEFDIYLYTRADGRAQPLTNGGNNQSPRVNNRRDVVWTRYDFSVQPWIGRIMLYSDGAVTDITPGECQCQGPDINDAGHVVWQDNTGVQFWDGEMVTMLAPIAGTARINDADEVSLAIWDFRENLRKHAIFKSGAIYVLPSFGFTTSRSSLNDRAEMAMNLLNLDNGHRELFLLRREGTNGDFNQDCVIDLYDAWILQRCGTAEPGPEGELLAECTRGDFDGDSDIDSQDWAAFINAYTGPGSMIDGCEP